MPETTAKLKSVLNDLMTHSALNSDEINEIKGLGRELIEAAEGLKQSLKQSTAQNTQSLKIPLEKILTLPASQQAIDSALKPAVQKITNVLSETIEGMLEENKKNRDKMLGTLKELDGINSQVSKKP